MVEISYVPRRLTELEELRGKEKSKKKQRGEEWFHIMFHFLNVYPEKYALMFRRFWTCVKCGKVLCQCLKMF